jgi:hypothetical protein
VAPRATQACHRWIATYDAIWPLPSNSSSPGNIGCRRSAAAIFLSVPGRHGTSLHHRRHRPRTQLGCSCQVGRPPTTQHYLPAEAGDVHEHPACHRDRSACVSARVQMPSQVSGPTQQTPERLVERGPANAAKVHLIALFTDRQSFKTGCVGALFHRQMPRIQRAMCRHRVPLHGRPPGGPAAARLRPLVCLDSYLTIWYIHDVDAVLPAPADQNRRSIGTLDLRSGSCGRRPVEVRQETRRRVGSTDFANLAAHLTGRALGDSEGDVACSALPIRTSRPTFGSS